MRIGIDGYNLAIPHGTGVATYGHALGFVLKAAGHGIEGVFGIDVGRDPAMREVLFFDRLGRPAPERTRAQLKREQRRIRSRALWPGALLASEVALTDRVEKAALAGRFPPFDRLTTTSHLFEIAHRHFKLYRRFLTLRLQRPPDVMHWTYPVPIRMAGTRNVYTLHDLVPLRLPYTTLDVKADYRRLIARCVRDADHLCTVSEASARDIVDEFGVDPARLTNTYQASPLPSDLSRSSADEDAAMIESVLGLKRDGYFLYFGAMEPKKNVGRLLEAFLSLDTRTRLILVGSRAWQSEQELQLLALASAAGAASGEPPSALRRVIRLEHLPRPLLLKLIRGARAVVFPSLYEGFGLPVLEAMQLGVPLLTSKVSSLPEVAGKAAIYVDPYDSMSIAGGLRALDCDAVLRGRLAHEGLVRAQQFSAGRYIERLESLYARVLDGVA